jgi:hypothetical protein
MNFELTSVNSQEEVVLSKMQTVTGQVLILKQAVNAIAISLYLFCYM